MESKSIFEGIPNYEAPGTRKRRYFETETDPDMYSEHIKEAWENEQRAYEPKSVFKEASFPIIQTTLKDEFRPSRSYCILIEGVVIHDKYACECKLT
jgi:hypothetical protein